MSFHETIPYFDHKDPLQGERCHEENKNEQSPNQNEFFEIFERQQDGNTNLEIEEVDEQQQAGDTNLEMEEVDTNETEVTKEPVIEQEHNQVIEDTNETGNIMPDVSVLQENEQGNDDISNLEEEDTDLETGGV